MLFLLEVEAAAPLPVPPAEFLKSVVAEWEMFLRLHARGKVLAGGKLAGRRGAAAIFEVADAAELDRIVTALPLFRWFSRIRVTPLVPAADALEEARRFLKLASLGAA